MKEFETIETEYIFFDDVKDIIPFDKIFNLMKS
jgi:hypothetical protein